MSALKSVRRSLSILVLFAIAVSACAPAAPTPTSVPPTQAAPTAVPPTAAPPTVAPLTEIKIGAVLPLTGPSAPTGLNAKIALEAAELIINSQIDDLAGMNFPFATSIGIPALQNAKIKFVFGDDQNVPEKSLAETERLITAEKVVIILGGYSSSCAATGSQVCERLGIPYIAPTATAPNLTERGYKWFFRLSPTDDILAKNTLEFIRDMNDKYGTNVSRIATIHENTLFGAQNSEAINRWAREFKISVVANVPYPKETTDLTSEIQILKAARPQVIIPASYVADAILTLRTMSDLDFNVDAVVAQNTGYTDSSFLSTIGKPADYVISRDTFSLDLFTTKPAIGPINDRLYKPKREQNIDSTGARWLTGGILAADALQRAASVKPADLQKALAASDVAGEDIIVPWDGIQFDEKGQNVLAKTLILQVKDGRFWTIWPFELSVIGTPGCPLDEIVWPMPKWSERM